MNRINVYESICLLNLKSGKSFYTTKKDKDITALATYYKKKIKTERVIAINSKHTTLTRLTKVTIS